MKKFIVLFISLLTIGCTLGKCDCGTECCESGKCNIETCKCICKK